MSCLSCPVPFHIFGLDLLFFFYYSSSDSRIKFRPDDYETTRHLLFLHLLHTYNLYIISGTAAHRETLQVCFGIHGFPPRYRKRQYVYRVPFCIDSHNATA